MSRTGHLAASLRIIARSFICTLLASNALAYSGIQIQSTSRFISCVPYNLTWTGGAAPFTLNFVPYYVGIQPPSGLSVSDVVTSFYLWIPNFPSATGFKAYVSDGTSTTWAFAWNDHFDADDVDGCTDITEPSSSTTSSILPTIATQPIFTISFPTSTTAPTPSPAVSIIYGSPTPTQPPSSGSSRQWNVGAAVAGGAVGVVFLSTVAAGFYFRRQRRRDGSGQGNGVWAEWNEDQANADAQSGRISQVDSDESFGTDEQQGLIGSDNASGHSAPSGLVTRIRGLGNGFLGSPFFGRSSISSSDGDDPEAAIQPPSGPRRSMRRGLIRTVLSDISEKTEPTEVTSLSSSVRSPPIESPQLVSERLPNSIVSQETVHNVATPQAGRSAQDGRDSRTSSLQSTERSDTTASEAARDITGMLRRDESTGLVGTSSDRGRTIDRNSTSTWSSPPHSSQPSPSHTLMSILDVPTPSTPDLDPNFPPHSPQAPYDSPTHRPVTRRSMDTSSLSMSRVDSPLPLASSPDLDPDLRRSRSAARKSSMQSFSALTDHMVSRADTMSSTDSEVGSFGTRASSLVVDPDIHTTQPSSPILTSLRPAGHRASSPRQILRAKSKDKIRRILADVPESVTSSDGKESPRLVESPVSRSDTMSLRGEHPSTAYPGGSNDHA
ncbi:hypothetical protein C8Q80DRAFT_1272983 [Daedaleopsis nitida]|nr:hypothetical protein C8Q80DRAFT_1272983 [Daedaleopsis nitida]